MYAPYPISLVIGERSRRHIAPKLWTHNKRFVEHICVVCGARGGLAYRELTSSGDAGSCSQARETTR